MKSYNEQYEKKKKCDDQLIFSVLTYQASFHLLLMPEYNSELYSGANITYINSFKFSLKKTFSRISIKT